MSYEFDPHCVSYTCRFVPNLSSVHQTSLVNQLLVSYEFDPHWVSYGCRFAFGLADQLLPSSEFDSYVVLYTCNLVLKCVSNGVIAR